MQTVAVNVGKDIVMSQKGKLLDRSTNVAYFLVYCVAMVACLCVQYLPHNGDMVKILDSVFGYHGVQLVYRISFATACAYSLLMLLTYAMGWVHKMRVITFLVIEAVFAALFLFAVKGKWFFKLFQSVAQWVGIGCILYQIYSICSFAFELSDDLLNMSDARSKEKPKADGEMDQWKRTFVFFSVLASLLSAGMLIAGFVVFRVNGKLSGSMISVLVIQIAAFLLTTILSLDAKVGIGMFVPSVMSFVLTCYTYIAVLSSQDELTNPYIGRPGWPITAITVTLNVFHGLWMCKNCRCVEAEDKKSSHINSQEAGKFHGGMAIMSLYLTVLCTFWYDGDLTTLPPVTLGTSPAKVYWTYLCTSWAISLVYLVGVFYKGCTSSGSVQMGK